MNAIQPVRTLPRRPESPRRTSVRSQQLRKRSQLHKVVAAEVGVKIAVNVVLSIAAISALVKLVPYNVAQQAKLKELTTEVAAAETRVSRVQTSFNRSFDPQEARMIMQEQTHRVDARQRPIVWVTPPDSENRP